MSRFKKMSTSPELYKLLPIAVIARRASCPNDPGFKLPGPKITSITGFKWLQKSGQAVSPVCACIFAALMPVPDSALSGPDR